MSLRPTTPEEAQALVQAQPRLLPRGGGSKPALSTPPQDVPSLELSGLSGVLEYEPDEYTFTALAGTPVAEVEKLLARHGQYLPFDPLLAEKGATLGGTVAAGVSGPGRQRYGGVRDFLIGVRFINGAGQLVHGGGKVVKNAAGFDLPKLMVGSLGRLGVLIELTFKVFPGPAAYTTLKLTYPHLETALTDIYRLATSALELHALDLEPAEGAGGRKQAWTLWVRLGGLAEALPARVERMREFLLAPKGGATSAETFDGSAESDLWQQVKNLTWTPADSALVKVPLTLKRIPTLEAQLNKIETQRRYSAAGNLVWLAWPATGKWADKLGKLLTDLDLSGLVLLGPPGVTRLGVNPGASLARRVKQALDPGGRFLEIG
ncbi:MAG: FAD-binding protein [Anaerolineae bacterium]|nr:FAD-binding protein [Anaerolineales bacterium]MCQ3977277.1 2-hydroxy-acid oxidase [Anaerolineae bacterium]